MNKSIHWSWKGSSDPEVKVGVLTINTPLGPHDVPNLDFSSAKELIDVIDAFAEQAREDGEAACAGRVRSALANRGEK